MDYIVPVVDIQLYPRSIFMLHPVAEGVQKMTSFASTRTFFNEVFFNV